MKQIKFKTMAKSNVIIHQTISWKLKSWKSINLDQHIEKPSTKNSKLINIPISGRNTTKAKISSWQLKRWNIMSCHAQGTWPACWPRPPQADANSQRDLAQPPTPAPCIRTAFVIGECEVGRCQWLKSAAMETSTAHPRHTITITGLTAKNIRI